ncbi:MFS transporter [Chloroflexota bacterium]
MKTFSSLRNPVFRLYYGAILAQRANQNMQLVTRTYLIYHLTGSATLLGAISLAFALPMFLTCLVGGVIADRVQKKKIIIASQASSAVIALIIALSLTQGYLSPERTNSWWILMAASVLTGVVSGLEMPSRQAIVREIVGEQKLMNAIALDNMAMNILRLIAPAVAGFLIDAYDFHVVYYTITAMSVISIILVAFMPLTGKVTKSGRNILANIKDGIQYIGRNKSILFILVFVLIAMLLSRPVLALMPIFVDKDHLNVGATGMGILLSGAGAGAIIGSIILASLPSKKRGLLLLVGSLVVGMALISFSFSSSLYLALAFMVIFGLGHTIRETLGNTLIQSHVDNEYRGRVMSVYEMEFAFTSLGIFAAGLLAEVADVQLVLSSFAMVLLLITISVIAFVPRIRRLD